MYLGKIKQNLKQMKKKSAKLKNWLDSITFVISVSL